MTPLVKPYLTLQGCAVVVQKMWTKMSWLSYFSFACIFVSNFSQELSCHVVKPTRVNVFIFTTIKILILKKNRGMSLTEESSLICMKLRGQVPNENNCGNFVWHFDFYSVPKSGNPVCGILILFQDLTRFIFHCSVIGSRGTLPLWVSLPAVSCNHQWIELCQIICK